MEGLKDMGIDDNTLIVFSSDNGPDPSFQNARTASMRGQKGNLYEGGIRLPFIVRWPNHIAPNQVNTESVICSVDLLPTFCKIVGATLPTTFSIDGEDRSSIILGGNNVERTKPLFWEFGKMKANRVSPHIAVREGDWKLLVNADGTKVELYNLKTDLYETTNVASANSTISNNLKTKALDWYKTAYRQYADLGTGLKNTSISEEIGIFPNPAQNHLQIQTSLQNYTTEIFSIDGKSLKLQGINATYVDISKLQKGLYLISIEKDGNKYFKKFIKE